MSEHLTQVQIAFYPDYLNYWLRFGEPDDEFDLDRRRALAMFKPGRVFGYIRWRANEFGTQEWQFIVARTAAPSRFLSCIGGVSPGGEVLLFTAGDTRVKRALLAVDALEAAGFDPADVSTAYYRHVHNRVASGKPFRAYSAAQHNAYLAAQEIAS